MVMVMKVGSLAKLASSNVASSIYALKSVNRRFLSASPVLELGDVKRLAPGAYTRPLLSST